MAADGAGINGGLAAIHGDLFCLTILIQERNPTVALFTFYFITWAKLEVIRPTEVSWEVYTSVGFEKLRTLSQLTCPGLPEQTQHEHLDLLNRTAHHACEHTENAALETHSMPKGRAPVFSKTRAAVKFTCKLS